MKKNIFLFWVLLSTLVGGVSCSSEELPANPTIVSPVSSLVLSVEGMDYVAVPRLKEDKTLDNVLTLEVRKASTKAVVKSIVLADASAEANVAVGDEVTFTGNRWELVLKRGMETGSYFVEMVYNEPPFMYFVKTGDYGPEGERYYVNPDKSQKIASINYDTKFEGYIDLTGTNRSCCFGFVFLLRLLRWSRRLKLLVRDGEERVCRWKCFCLRWPLGKLDFQ